MLIPLPRNAVARKQALDWLALQGVRHLRLFEVVELDTSADADRFKAWLARQDPSSRPDPTPR